MAAAVQGEAEAMGDVAADLGTDVDATGDDGGLHGVLLWQKANRERSLGSFVVRKKQRESNRYFVKN
jgi:hypothetical protein